MSVSSPLTPSMTAIYLKYGQTQFPFDYDESRFEVLTSKNPSIALSDAEIGVRLGSPIGSDTLENIVQPGETVLFVVSDATRKVGAGQILNLIVRRLIANGTAPFEMAAIFATGIHRPVTEAEKQEILTPFIAQRIKTFDHDARDLMQLMQVGETSSGISVELNRKLTEVDHVVLIGGINFHYYAGFTGGRKLVCPGLASSRTISATHKLAFDCKRMDRREGVGTGLLDGNAVHEAFVEAASKVKVSFAVNTIVNDAGSVTDLFCGDWIDSHRAACDGFSSANSASVDERRDMVIASCGGYPHDLNLIQAHKALEAASQACNDGGTIILIAECRDGLGRDDFLNWFEAENSSAVGEKLCRRYQVNGQTAWSLMRKTERFRVRLLTSLHEVVIAKLRGRKISIEDLRSEHDRFDDGYIIPGGAKLRIEINSV